jgi:TRAP-type mannitol/chloroaromatic compound transport system permease small subunit
MTEAMVCFVKAVDRFNYRVGRFAMYLIFLLMGVLLWSSFSKVTGNPSLWTLEFAQFVMVAYYLLGGAYSVQLGDHVRMDLLYGSFRPRLKAAVDLFSVLLVVFYLGVLLYGGISSSIYAIEYSERAHSVWRPYMWPIKIIGAFGVLMMLIQIIAEFFRDVLFLKGISVSHQSETGI